MSDSQTISNNPVNSLLYNIINNTNYILNVESIGIQPGTSQEVYINQEDVINLSKIKNVVLEFISSSSGSLTLAQLIDALGYTPCPLDGNALVPLVNLPNNIPKTKISGLGNAAGANFGTTTGSVADGGVVANINNQVSNSSSSISTQGSSISNLSNSLSGLSNTINNSLTTLNSNVANITSNINTLDSDLTSINSSINTLNSNVNSVSNIANAAMLPGFLFTDPVTGGFGNSNLGTETNAAFKRVISRAIALGCVRSPQSFNNSGEDATVPISALKTTTPTVINTANTWMCQEHYAADYALSPTSITTSPTINPTIIMQAAINWCSRVNQQNAVKNLATHAIILFTEFGVYPGLGQLIIPDAGEVYIDSAVSGKPMAHFICPLGKDSYASGSDGVFCNQTVDDPISATNPNGWPNNIHLGGFAITRGQTDAYDIWSGMFTTNLKGRMVGSAGNWTGITPQFCCQLSANTNAIAVMSTNVANASTLYFDQTGVDTNGNPTITAYTISGSAGNRIYSAPFQMTLAQFTSYVTNAGSNGLAAWCPRIIGQGVTVVSVAYSTLSGHTGFQVVMQAPVNRDNYYGHNNSTGIFVYSAIPPKAAQVATPATAYTPELESNPAIPAPMITFTTGLYNNGQAIWNNAAINYPWFPRGTSIYLWADNLTLRGLVLTGCSQGQAVVMGGGDRVHCIDCESYCNDMRQNTGGIKLVTAGAASGIGYATLRNTIINTGDQCIEPQAAVVVQNSTGMYKPWNNNPVIYWDLYDCDLSCANAAALATAAPIDTNQQEFGATVNGTISAASNIVNFPTTDPVSGSPPFLPLGAGISYGTMPWAAQIGWNYLQSGYTNTVCTNNTNSSANNILIFASQYASGMLAGAFVDGYMDAGGSVGSFGNTGTCTGIGPYQISFAVPQGATRSNVFKNTISNARMLFSSRTPIGSLTTSINVRVFGGHLLSAGDNQAVSVANQNDSMVTTLIMFGTKINCWYQWASGAVGINLNGSNFGGCTVKLYGVEVTDAMSQSISTIGNSLNLFTDPGCLFGQPQSGRITNYTFTPLPNVYCAGDIYGTIGGEIQGSINSYNLQVGDVNGVLGTGVAALNGSNNAKVSGARLTYIQSGQYGIFSTNSNNVLITDVDFIQASPPGSGYNAGGIYLAGNSSGYPNPSLAFRINSANFSGIDGNVLFAGSGTTYYTGDDIIPNSVGALPTAAPSPMKLANFAALLNGDSAAIKVAYDLALSNQGTAKPSNAGSTYINGGFVVTS